MSRMEPARPLLYLRSGAFLLLLALSTVVYASLAPLTLLLSFSARYQVLTSWGAFNIWLCARICGLDYTVKGLQNLPAQPSIVLANHQSTWETMLLSRLFPPVAWVVKRELMWIPFFGWGLALVQPIAIDRTAGKRASEQLVEQGRACLEQGRWIVIFPQGTRVAPGEQRRFKLGGALLASRTGAPVIPLAHNAGQFWPRRRFIKYPGTITVSIGPAIDSRGKSPEAINAAAKSWIEAEEARIRASCQGNSGLQFHLEI
jgi:1-acyl-sn-glycerol-3-phosphate acyltransferase